MEFANQDTDPTTLDDTGRHGRWSRGVYLITPDDADTDHLLAVMDLFLEHAALLQYRNKSASSKLRRTQAEALRERCTAHGIPLIINDDIVLASAVGADGVHLGEADEEVKAARDVLGMDAIIGVSCYDDPERARSAALSGASYIAFGAFFPSSTKPNARRATFDLLRDSVALGLPRVAIGGITPDNARSVVAAGADLIAVISGVFSASDPAAAMRAYRMSFD